jgi:hypothetical protein
MIFQLIYIYSDGVVSWRNVILEVNIGYIYL